MAFGPTSSYTARIGGIIYRNVARPVVVAGQSLFNFEREEESGRLVVSFVVNREDGNSVVAIVRNEVSMLMSGYLVLEQAHRRAVVEESTGRVWAEINMEPQRDCSASVEM